MAGYYFRLPAITQLTISQQAALGEPNQIALSGGPELGKALFHYGDILGTIKSILFQ